MPLFRTSFWRSHGLAILVTLLFLALAWFCFRAVSESVPPRELIEGIAERAEKGKPPGIKQYQLLGMWWANLINGLMFLAIAASAFWWTKWFSTPQSAQTSSSIRHWYYWALAAIMVGGALLRWERLDLSFWTDEEWSLRLYVLGDHHIDEEGRMSFSPHSWERTLYYNKESNNHLLFSAIQRVCLEAWQDWTGSPRWSFNERVARLPSWFAGLATVGLWGFLIMRLGYPGIGLVTSLLLALHPWHVRMSSEGRGYALAMLCLTAGTWFLYCALRSGRWRYWVGWSLFQALSLLSFFGTLPVIVLWNMGAALWLFRSRQSTVLPAMRRWLVSGMCSLAVVLWLAAPNLLWLWRFLEKSRAYRGHESSWQLWEILSHYTFGMSFHRMGSADNTVLSALEVSGAPLFSAPWPLAILTICLIGVGAATLGKKDRTWTLLCLLPIAAAFCVVFIHVMKGNGLFFPVYVIFALPFYVVFMSSALVGIARWLGDRFHPALFSVSLLVAIGAYIAVVRGHLTNLMRYPLENFRGALATTRALHEDPYQTDPSNVITVALWQKWPAYDPRLRTRIHLAEQLEEVMREAMVEKKILYVVVGNYHHASSANAGFLRVLRKSGHFELQNVFYGHYEPLTLRVYRFNPREDSILP